MGDVQYRVQGVDLTDQRWAASPVTSPNGKRLAGVWELLKGTGLLPDSPGFAVTRFEKPDQHGESQAQFAPVTPTSSMISVRVWAVDGQPSSPMFRQAGDTVGQRLRMLQANVAELFFRTQLGAAGSKGLLEVERTYSVDGEPQYAAGRFTTRVTPEYGPDYMWADYHLMFDNPFGTWTGPEVTITETVGTSWTDVHVPMGTAPVWDALIAARSNTNELLGARFRNDQGVGFNVSAFSGNGWRVYDTRSRISSLAGAASEPAWDAPFNRAATIEEVGRPQGTALLINPGVAGNPDQVGLVRVRYPSAGTVMIRYRPRYF